MRNVGRLRDHGFQFGRGVIRSERHMVVTLRQGVVGRYGEREREWIVDGLIGVPEAAGRVGEADGGAERRSLHLGVVGESRVAGVQEHSGSAANAGLAVTERIVGEAEAWSEVV